MSDNDQSLSNPAIDPEKSVVTSQEAQPHIPANVAGSAMLDAQVVAGRNEPEGDPINYPIATNFVKADATGDPKTAGSASMMGTYSPDEPVSEKGSVNLHNNPEIPSEQMQGTLPNTDPIGMPIDSETNFPD
ncbi:MULTISPECIES: hypothetical protein [Calothrix]|uniref:Uncharacterized protein n=2 Tax=Calothrix TaxID=1186 RepID=A0ABR8AA54_9CYAN|nr:MULTISPECIES: hypothetical protein [Calothrix]MBD2196832.1 hypothetical protein [Calothrix parietina FACHB-288]MBD2225384.1 hypothetical protein [Calothrix anomala FACHB-343]